MFLRERNGEEMKRGRGGFTVDHPGVPLNNLDFLLPTQILRRRTVGGNVRRWVIDGHGRRRWWDDEGLTDNGEQ
jgi:hypothetical protein